MMVNFFAGIYSIGYYLPQLNNVSPLLWLFVIDCPLYAILFGIILLLKIKNINFALLNFIVVAGSIKYALWTLFVLLLMNNQFSFFLLTIGHFFLLLQVIIFYKYSEFKLKHLLIVMSWFLLNDFFDYVLLTHPFFDTNFFVEVASFSILMSIFVTLFVSIFFSKK